jgi:hypothetical protein
MAGVEFFLVPDVAQELLPPLLHEVLVALGDDESALRLAVAVTVPHAPSAPPPRGTPLPEKVESLGKLRSHRGSQNRHVKRARGQLQHIVGAEGEAETASTEIGVECPIGARTDAAVAGRTAATRRHPTRDAWEKSGA